jgi:hypothetical protein
MSTPGAVLPGGIVLVDEPESLGISTFADSGEVLMTITCRPGDDCSQIIIGLTANQAVQMVEALHMHNDACLRAIAQGKGGAKFKTEAKA